jgi:hypothetical protein
MATKKAPAVRRGRSWVETRRNGTTPRGRFPLLVSGRSGELRQAGGDIAERRFVPIHPTDGKKPGGVAGCDQAQHLRGACECRRSSPRKPTARVPNRVGSAVELGFRHDDHADQGVAVRKAGCVWW